jgi:4-hydroxythreonine-4-phosphate dehydrogenase
LRIDFNLSLRVKPIPVIAITCGEPAGIGPEIALRAAWQVRDTMTPVLIGDATLLAMTAAGIEPAIKLLALSRRAFEQDGLPAVGRGRLLVIDCPVAQPVVPGTLDARNGRHVLDILDTAIDGAMAHRFDAIVTAPLQKSTINDAGVPFTGHTEYLAERTATPRVVMMLACATSGALAAAPGKPAHPLRVALATTHLALKDVPAAITIETLAQTLAILHADLVRKFGIAAPRILVTGLNPHAGEGGYLGREEIDVIAPAIAAARDAGMLVSGPYPADTLFQPKYLQDADCVLAMYHDQGLPVLKFASFGQGVNITLGLPIIRTSVDHGTALDLAAKGLGHADHGSMLEALRVACEMADAAGGQVSVSPLPGSRD